MPRQHDDDGNGEGVPDVLFIITKIEESDTADGPIGPGRVERDDRDDRVRDDQAVERRQLVLESVFLLLLRLVVAVIILTAAFDGGVDAPFLAVAAGEMLQFGGDTVDDVLGALTRLGGRDGEDGDVLFAVEAGVALGPADVGFDFAPHGLLGGMRGVEPVAATDAEG